MDTGIVMGTSREEDPSHSAPAMHPSQNASTSQPLSSSRSEPDDSPFTPEKDENVVKLDDFDSFLDFFKKKYVSSCTRANTESDSIHLP
jgi:hypothetical protein